MIKIQDAYIIGLRLHGELIKRKIHSVAASEGKEGFDRVWQEAVSVVKTLVDTRNIDLLDPGTQAIDWTFYSPSENDLQR